MASSAFAAQLVLGLVFCVAGAEKLRTGGLTREEVQQYRLVPPAVSRIAARALPPMEIILGLLCLTGIVLTATVAALALVLAAFCLGIALLLREGIRPPCHCLGQRSSRISQVTLLRNGLLVLAAVDVLLANPLILSPGDTATMWQTRLSQLSGLSYDVSLATYLIAALLIMVALFHMDRLLTYLETAKTT